MEENPNSNYDSVKMDDMPASKHNAKKGESKTHRWLVRLRIMQRLNLCNQRLNISVRFIQQRLAAGAIFDGVSSGCAVTVYYFRCFPVLVVNAVGLVIMYKMWKLCRHCVWNQNDWVIHVHH
ncbi:hypothetical protein NPIL_230271 [Nephila pilipes]|uniref:Uncharacterized protein n=1 Tax=Nephila pilipes TaxID=299642 RepID=A0A8X6THP2_NEPPI|nr:hypothetical protein NPIL_230271 [Nephila pilipes]